MCIQCVCVWGTAKLCVGVGRKPICCWTCSNALAFMVLVRWEEAHDLRVISSLVFYPEPRWVYLWTREDVGGQWLLLPHQGKELHLFLQIHLCWCTSGHPCDFWCTSLSGIMLSQPCVHSQGCLFRSFSGFWGQWHEPSPVLDQVPGVEWLQHLPDTNQPITSCIPFQEFGHWNASTFCSMSSAGGPPRAADAATATQTSWRNGDSLSTFSTPVGEPAGKAETHDWQGSCLGTSEDGLTLQNDCFPRQGSRREDERGQASV